MDQQQTGIRSTRPKSKQPPRPTPEQEMADAMECPPQSPNNDRCHQVFMTVTEVNGKLYSDQTGRFPITSTRLLPRLEVMGKQPVWSLYSLPSNSATVMKTWWQRSLFGDCGGHSIASAISRSGVGLGRCFDLGLVDLMPVLRWSMWPISVSSTTLICSRTRLDVRIGHHWK